MRATDCGPRNAVAWHDAECGSYEADLPVWERLAGPGPSRVLDLGCGTGRVALRLARRGHEVVGVDRHPDLVAELDRRAADAGLAVTATVGDARALELGRRFDLALAPMQLFQLLESGSARRASLGSIAAHLEPSGRAAIALVDVASATPACTPPVPDLREVDGWVFSSLPVGVRRGDGGIVVSRLRQRVSPGGDFEETTDEVLLRELSPTDLEAEAEACGLRAAERIEVEPTADHVGSTVVVLGVA